MRQDLPPTLVEDIDAWAAAFPPILDEIDSLIAAAHRTGTVSFVYASEPEGPAQQLTLSSGGEALQLAIAVGGAAVS